MTQDSAQADDMVLLQDILDEIVNGRTKGHPCPWCSRGPVDAKLDEGGVRVQCPDCGKFFEGKF